MSTKHEERFAAWCVAELFGHKKFAGLVSEWELAGVDFLRLDIYVGDDPDPAISRLYHPNAVYCLTPTDEAICRAFSRRNVDVPLARWELPAPDATATTAATTAATDGPWQEDERDEDDPF